MLKVLVETAIASNAEVAAVHEQALAATTELTTVRMSDINGLAENAIATMGDLKSVLLDHILPAVVSINDRQDAVEQVSGTQLMAIAVLTFYEEGRDP
jgi:hypothetical protein